LKKESSSEIRRTNKSSRILKTGRYFNVLFFAALGVAILWLITRNHDLSKIWDEFRQASLGWIFLAFISGWLSHITRTLRWNLLIGQLGETPKFSTTFYSLMTGMLANLAVPRLGEITRCATLSKYTRHPFNSLAGTVVAERIFDVLTLMVLILITLFFQFTFLKEFLDSYIFKPFMGRFNSLAWLLLTILCIGFLILAFLIRFIQKTDSSHPGVAGKFKRQIVGFWQGFISLNYLNNKGLFLLLSVLIWTFYFLTVYFVFFALPGTSGLGVADGFTILAMGSLGVLAPVPGGLGTYHFIVITTMSELLKVAPESAISYAYISHATQMATVLILGGLSWIMLSLRFQKVSSPVLPENT
jgi:glycosyltransferase 2 family protein